MESVLTSSTKLLVLASFMFATLGNAGSAQDQLIGTPLEEAMVLGPEVPEPTASEVTFGETPIGQTPRRPVLLPSSASRRALPIPVWSAKARHMASLVTIAPQH